MGNSSPARQYIPALDWLKALGITLIIMGHLAGGLVNSLTPPVYPKQLGVAFFIFALGYSLAAETRSAAEVMPRRLFELFLWGLTAALVYMGWSFVSSGRLALGNFLPFAAGVNVVRDTFPPNPTTWFIGLYIHLLVLWALARRVYLTIPLLAGVLMIEVLGRALIAEHAGLFVAYMTVPNWILVFSIGYAMGQRDWSPTGRLMLGGVGMTAFALLAYYAIWPAIGQTSFPFMKVRGTFFGLDFLPTSCVITALYVGWTGLVLFAFGHVQPPAPVRFIARNTVLVFIAHMPLFYWLDPVLQELGAAYPVRSAVEILVCLPGLALCSELIHYALPIHNWRSRVGRALAAPTQPQPVA